MESEMDDRTYDLMVQQAKKYGDALTELSFAKSRIERLETAMNAILRYDRDTDRFDARDVAAMREIALCAFTGDTPQTYDEL